MNPIMNSRSNRPAFTLTEMMIAMAVTLLMMAALGKTFALMGESIREGRVKVSLTSQLRDITLRMNSELERCTVPINPSSPDERGDGYFLYYEGPLSNATGTLMGHSPDTSNQNTLQDSRIGDLDDYIAFTAIAEAGNWFRGKVPRFLLDAKQSQLRGVTYLPSDYPGNPFDPVVITSKYAEIIYFASPEYNLAPDNQNNSQSIFAYNNDAIGNPTYIDDDTNSNGQANGIPDRVRLHRRVLLIRPDLNLGTANNPGLATYSHVFGPTTVNYMVPDNWRTDSSPGPGTATAPPPNVPEIKTQTVNGISRDQTSQAWLFGMAPIHQQCDLSVRRGLTPSGFSSGGTPLVGGRPNNQVFANSLADLTKPENRFAHVRIPGTMLNTSLGDLTSMPVLACGGLPTILDPTTNAAVPPSTGAVVTPGLMNGFIRPEFVLGMDHTHTDHFGDGWGIERLSEDVIASGVIGFDIQGFDESAQTFISFGPDGQPGLGNVDDDNNNTTDDAFESGYANTDDVVVGPNDAAMRELLVNSFSSTVATRAQRGDFVDLFHPFQAGGTVRGFAELNFSKHDAAVGSFSRAHLARFTVSDLSGVNPDVISSNSALLYSDSLFRSGRLITAGGGVVFLQPAYDTFSDHYEHDGFYQGDPGSLVGSVWYFNEGDSSQSNLTADLGSNGIDDDGFDTADLNSTVDPNEGSFGVDGFSEQETSAPFNTPLPAIKISIRLENTTTRQVEQMSSITNFE